MADQPRPNVRAYSFITIKSVNEDQRIIEGIASTPTPDRMDDIVNPMGAKFSLPLPFLWQHNHDEPIGHVIEAKATKAGITFKAKLAQTSEPGKLKDLLDFAWQSIKMKLVSAVSIGFQPLKYAFLSNGGIEFEEWSWYELSAVTIPAQTEATITSIKSIDADLRKAAGVVDIKFVPVAPAASGKTVRLPITRSASGASLTPKPKETAMSKKIGDQIAALKEQRKQLATDMESIQQKALDDGRSKDADERQKFDEAHDQVKALDAEIADLEAVEKLHIAPSAKALDTDAEPARYRAPAAVKKETVPGLLFAQMVKVKAVARLESEPKLVTAEKMYGRDSQVFNVIKAGEVTPGTATSGNWAVDLISPEGAAVADFVEYLRSQTILGKFGVGGIPSLRSIGFYEPYAIQTAGGAGYWVGDGKPIGMTSFDFDRSTLTPLKLGSIAALTERNIRYSSPKSDVIVRDELVKVLVATEDTAFIDPSNNGTSNIKPASVTYGAETIASTGDDADDVRLDIRALFKKFTEAHNPARQGVFILSSDNAVALRMMTNGLSSARDFPDISLDGGTIEGIPAIVSDYAGDNVALINASDIYMADEGEVAVDVSREASLEFKDGSNLSQDGAAGTGASLVSLWQNDMVGVRALKTVNWKLRRASAVAYLTSVSWGGAVPAS